FQAPATESQLAALAESIAVVLPSELRELLLESDGITADFGSGIVWPLGEIRRHNREFRENADFSELYMPFDHLLFFGEDGDGDQFAFAIQADGHIRRPDVFRWEHETDARTWYAGRLEQFFERRLSKDS